jgi:hypothetical protein
MSAIRLWTPPAAVAAAALACAEPADPAAPTGTGDSVPPVVTDLAPAPGEEGVRVTTTVTVRFSEPINPATVGPASFQVRRGFDPVPGSYTFGDRAVSFVPDGDLAFAAVFSATLTRGIRDPAGNALPRDTVWSFQTASAAVPATRR